MTVALRAHAPSFTAGIARALTGPKVNRKHASPGARRAVAGLGAGAGRAGRVLRLDAGR